jgi:hypothetical protein
MIPGMLFVLQMLKQYDRGVLLQEKELQKKNFNNALKIIQLE